MSAEYLTPIFDIHGGGMDLIFPHHENEIAQSCAACPESNVSYWMHNGFVTTNDEKMSKSLGNFFTIRKVNGASCPIYFLLIFGLFPGHSISSFLVVTFIVSSSRLQNCITHWL